MRFELLNWRCSFPTIWTPEPFPDSLDPTPYFSCAFIAPPEHPQRAQVQKIIDDLFVEKFGKTAAAVQAAAVRLGKVCLRDGDLKPQLEGYPGNWSFHARSKVRPTILNRDKTPLTEADGVIYSGCYVNAIVDLYAYTKGAKGVGAGLKGIRFVNKGDAFGGGAPANADAFSDNLADTGEDDDPAG